MSWSILNVDDDDAGRYSISRILSREGYFVSEAATGQACLDMTRSQPVDLVVLDVNLPDMNGIDVCQTLKSDPDTSGIPVLLLSASFVQTEDRVRGLELGADGYLTEPLEPEVLTAHVKALLRMRQAERQLERAKVEAETANRAKDRFLAMLSHELRTPLNPIMGAVELLSTMNVNDEIKGILDLIERNVNLEARLIDDLLDITRIERGKLLLRTEIVEFHKLVGEVVSLVRREITARGLDLNLQLNAREHILRGDAARLQQVIWNLVKNAVKFTPSGSITIETSNPEPGSLRLSVSDTGIGIESSLLGAIFNAFEQGSSAVHQAFGGLGLGLAISRGIVAAHEGSLVAHSEGRNRGSTFSVELATVSETAESVGQPHNSHSDDRGLRILFVDDHLDTGAMVKLLLERRGYNVTTATSVASAMSIAPDGHFDLLITDIGLPDGSGVELMEKLGPQIGIKGIAVSGYGMDSDVARSRSAGFSAHIVKPVNIDDLIATIEDVTTS